jgi:hypothetical protein
MIINASFSSPPQMGRGTIRRMVEGYAGRGTPLHHRYAMVPLPMLRMERKI